MRTRSILFRSCLALAALTGGASPLLAQGAGGGIGGEGGTLYLVSSIADLQARINGALPGDTIMLRNGVYTTTAAITVNRPGTAARPIRIQAQSIGGAEITGSHGFTVRSPATHVQIWGFLFTHLSGRNSIQNGATHIRFTRNTFQCTGNGAYLTVAGHDAQIDRNEFRNKSTLGNMIDVRGTGSQIAQRVWIHHNYFHDFTSPGGNGAETIRFGLSGLSLSNGFGLIEHNLFVRCTGENEMISNKSSANVYRYNTLVDSPGAELTLRHGNDCQVYGNLFRNTAGIRIFGDRHQVFSNYLETSTGINIGNGDGEVADGDPLTAHDRPDDCVITFNTLVSNTRNYFMQGRTNGLGATGTVFANNVIQGGGSAAGLNGLYTGAFWEGNVIWQTTSAGAMPPGTFEETDPLLLPGAHGILRPQPGSPLIDTAVGNYPAVVVDQDGQPRGVVVGPSGQAQAAPKDRGADEISNVAPAARFLTPEDLLLLIHSWI